MSESRTSNPQRVKRAGSVFAVKREILIKRRDFWGDHNGVIVTSKIEAMDIDDETDFSIAEILAPRYMENVLDIGEDYEDTIYLYDDPELGVKNLVSDDVWKRNFARYQKAIDYAQTRGGIWFDCASGSGYGSELIAEVAEHVVAVDIDPLKIKYAKKHHNKHGKVSFICGDISNLPLNADNYFDAAISIETIEHIKDCVPFLKKVYQMLKPGGIMVVTTPASQIGGGPNPLNKWHVNELTKSQFVSITSAIFDEVSYYSEHAVLTTGVLTEQLYGVCRKAKRN